MPSYTYNTNIPQSSNIPANSQGQILQNFQSGYNIWTSDHYPYQSSNSADGYHKQITFAGNNPASPNPPDQITVSPPVLFTNTVDGAGNALPNGVPELFFYSGTHQQGQDNYVSQTQGSVVLFGGIIMKWGNLSVPNGGSAVFTFPGNQFPNACFTVITTTRAIGPFTSGCAIPAQDKVTIYLEAAAGAPQAVYVVAIGN
jgi:hypothetical protein